MNARKLTMGWFATLTAMAGVLMLSGGQASASFTNFTFSSAFGSFTSAEDIAIDESTGDVYVFDVERSTVEKFDAFGNPVDFSASGSNAIGVSGERTENLSQIAVDNSSGPAKGDIYVTNFRALQIFGSDGNKLGELTEVAGRPWGRTCGVAVDRTGNVYVGLFPDYVNRYTPGASPATNADYTESLTYFGLICDVGADADGNVYVDNRGGSVIRFDASQFGVAEAKGTQVAGGSNATLAVANSFSGELFVDHEGGIVQYGESGNLLSTFGESAISVAINAKNGKLYLSNRTTKTIEIWQGTVALPSLQTGHATNLSNAGGATLNGAVEPEESAIGTCEFQYGTSESYGSVAACEQPPPLTGGGTVAVSAGLSGVPLNKVFHYRLAAENANGTEYGTDKTFAILVPPTVEDQAPSVSAITRASAKLTGTINPEQADTSYHFDIGVTEAYGQSTQVAHTGSGISSDTTIVSQMGELLPGRTYHYRLVADNVAGRVVGADHTFTTDGATPAVAVTGGSSGVAQNSATIAGVVDTNGLPTTYGFEIGTSTDYGPATGLGSVGAGASEAPVSLALTGLLPGTIYHYRLTATNIDGTSYGDDQTFATSVFASTFAEPPPPLPFVTVPSFAFPSEAKPGVVKKKVKAKPKKRGKAKGKKKAKHKKKK